MARSFAPLKSEIWAPGSGFRDLSPSAQWAYMLLISQPQITNLGTLPYTPKKWLRLAADLTLQQVEDAIDELARGYYVLVDHDTGELLIRTFIKHDKVYAQPALVTNARILISQVESDEIRDHILTNHPWLDADTWLADVPANVSKQERWREWDSPRITAHEESQESQPRGVSDGSLQPGLGPPVEGPGCRLPVAGAAANEKRKNQEPRPPESAAAELEAVRPATIKAAAERFAADRKIVEREAWQLPAVLFDDVVERVAARCNTGTVTNPAGLLIELTRRSVTELRERDQPATDTRTLDQVAIDDARSYARGQHPWDVAHELLERKLTRLGCENGNRAALLEAARAAYLAEAKAPTP